jgi:hypothetical protein
MDYDVSVFPPAPRLEIHFIALPHGTAFGPVHAFLDTGADVTIVPMDIIRQLKAGVVTFKTVRGYTRGRRNVRTYLVDVDVAGLTLPGIEVVGDDAADQVLIGRDVLNKLRLLLDGPGQRTEILG